MSGTPEYPRRRHYEVAVLRADTWSGSAATNNSTGEGVAIKKVTNVFSKKILAKRALREIKLLQHFRGESVEPDSGVAYEMNADVE